MPSVHSIRGACAASVLALALPASQMRASVRPELVSQPSQGSGTFNFTIFVRGLPVGNEQIALTRAAEGWTISSTGRIGAPLDIIGRKVQVRYTSDWQPVELTLDAIVRGQPQTLHTIVQGGTARSEGSVAGAPTQKSDTIKPDAVLLLPNSFFAPYEAVAARLKTAAVGSEITAYVAPAGPIVVRVGESAIDRIQTTSRLISARRTHLTLVFTGPALETDLWTDESGRMIRFSVPAQAVEAVREDIGAVSSRSVTVSRPNDESLKIPSNGFSLAGTLSRPANGSGKLPAVVLVGGSGPTDRDELEFGIPILGQIAGTLADAGFVVVRYDKRGIGQSGGRPESASLADYADDVRAVVKVLSDRKDIDPRRIAIVGHSEGGTVALMTAAKDKHVAAVGLLATSGIPGAELVLAQQQHVLTHSNLSAEEKQAKVDQEKKIEQAVMTGKGLDQLPAEIRRQVDNAEFQSILTSDPSKIIPEVHQPMLIVQGELDTQVEPSNADKLEALARKRKNTPPVEVVKVKGLNHLLVPAATGELEEYGSLKDSQVSPEVTNALVTWLQKTLVPSK
jgi:pimeloyl-ACP methyl ester carboxylesterase